METKKTSFGTMEKLSLKPLIERMTFNKEGKSHFHNGFEYCYILEGSGSVVGANKKYVKKGDFCFVPPNTEHWMTPNKIPFTLLIFYGDKE